MHGDPATCSQCKGAAARIVTVTDRGDMMIDGKPAGRRFYVEPPLPRNVKRARARRSRDPADLDQDDDID